MHKTAYLLFGVVLFGCGNWASRSRTAGTGAAGEFNSSLAGPEYDNTPVTEVPYEKQFHTKREFCDLRDQGVLAMPAGEPEKYCKGIPSGKITRNALYEYFMSMTALRKKKPEGVKDTPEEECTAQVYW